MLDPPGVGTRTTCVESDPAAAAAGGATACDLILATAAARANDTAIIHCGDRLPYVCLATRSARMAETLSARGVTAGAMVGVMLDRTPELLVSILGIWRLGAIYVPLEPSYPDDRLRYCAQDAEIGLLVTHSCLAAGRTLPAVEIFMVDRPEGRPNAVSGGGRRGGGPYDADAAYVIFTSGTTGKPKGVVGTHRGIVNSIQAQQRLLPFEHDDVACHKAPIGFIDAIFEALLPLASGVPLLLAPADRVRDPVAFLDLIESNGATRLLLVPSMARILLKVKDFSGRCRRLRCLMLNSEPIDRPLLSALAAALPSCRFFHAYGATETSGDMCFNELVVQPEVRPVTVGPPIENMHLRLLDRAGLLVPSGSPGEIHAGGVGIAKGYLNQPDLTAAKFVPDRSADTPEARLYRTGDMARQLPNGELELLGRCDRQVKVKGSRIELGEVEAVMREIPGIDDVAVVARKRESGDQLVAYVVLTPGSSEAPSRLRGALQRLLPAFMLPSAIHVLPRLPLSPNGKIDVRALEQLPDISSAAETRTEPIGAVELRLARVCAEVLELDRVDIDRSFLDLGGDSLFAMSLAAEIERVFGAHLPISVIFDADCLRALATEVGKLAHPPPVPAHASARERESGLLPLSNLQRMFWSLDRMTLHHDRDTFSLAVELSGPLNVEALVHALGETTDRHPMLRCRFVLRDDAVWQCPGGAPPVRPEHIDLSSRSAEANPRELAEMIRDLAARGFDLERGPPIAATLIRLAPERHVLLVTLHHLVADDLSLEIVEEDIASAYRRRLDAGRAAPPREPSHDAPDAYCAEPQVGPERLSRQLEYWRRQLKDATPVRLPLDRPRRPERGYQGATLRIDLPVVLSNRLKQLGRTCDATQFMTLAAVVAIWLSIASDQPDIVLRIDFSKRRRWEMQGRIGLFVNFLPVRVRVRASDNFAAILDLTREAVLEAIDHSDIAYDELAKGLACDFGSDTAGFDRIVLAMQRRPVPRDWLRGVIATEIEVELGRF